MFANSKTKIVSNENVIFNFIKGLIISIILSLVLVVLFALCLKWFDLSEKFIMPITFVIKYLSVVVGSLFAINGTSNGLIKGALFGLLYICFSFTIFSILANSFSFDLTTILDIISSILLGAIVGIIKVNKSN